jgi:hypothetical protein
VLQRRCGRSTHTDPMVLLWSNRVGDERVMHTTDSSVLQELRESALRAGSKKGAHDVHVGLYRRCAGSTWGQNWPHPAHEVYLGVRNVDSNCTWAWFGIPTGPAPVRALLEQAGAHRIARPLVTRPPGTLGPPKWWLASMAQPQIGAYELKENRGSILHIGIDAAAARVCFERMASG